jgi:hypothetical protein
MREKMCEKMREKNSLRNVQGLSLCLNTGADYRPSSCDVGGSLALYTISKLPSVYSSDKFSLKRKYHEIFDLWFFS